MAKSKKAQNKNTFGLGNKQISLICSIAATLMCLLAIIIELFSRENISLAWFVLLLTNLSIVLTNFDLSKLLKK